MSERSIEVPDPDPEHPAPVASESPYKNLLVPLVVVPFMVVGVLVLVFVFFGAVAGRDASIAENLDRVVRGGANESKQAAVNLVAQALENRVARLDGKPEPWPAPEDLAGKLDQSWVDVGDAPVDLHKRLAIAQLAALYRAPGAYDKLAAILSRVDELASGGGRELTVVENLQAKLMAVDPRDNDGQLRLYAMFALPWLEDPRAADLVIPFLSHGDPYIRQASAAVMQQLPGPNTAPALRQLLDDPALELRGQAAISLSHLGDQSGADVLLELLDPASYAAAHALEPKKYATEKTIQTSRLSALQALERCARASDRELLERLAREDHDPLVREGAMRALRAR